jgi:ribonuclease E
VPKEQNNGLGNADANNMNANSAGNESVNEANSNAAAADSTNSAATVSKRRRTGRRVVRVAGAAGAAVPVKVEGAPHPQAEQAENSDATQQGGQTDGNDRDGEGQAEAHTAEPKRRRSRRKTSAQVNADSDAERNTDAPSAASESKDDEPGRIAATGGSSSRRGKSAQNPTSGRQASSSKSRARADIVEFEEPVVEDEESRGRRRGRGRIREQQTEDPQDRSQRAAKAVDAIKFLQVDTAHSADKQADHKASRSKPMISPLFQEPVLPAASSHPADTDNSDSDDTEESPSASRRGNAKRGRNHRRHETTIEIIERGGKSIHDSADARDYDSTENVDEDDNREDEHSGHSRRSRRMNAQERRAAAEVGQIEDDLEYDEIPYDPIDDDTRAAKRSRRSRTRSSEAEENTTRHARHSESEQDEEQGDGRKHRSYSRDTDDDDNDSTVTRRRRRRRGSVKASEEESSEQSGSKRSRKQQYIDEITNIEGSTRLEAKRQRRRDNRRDRSRQTQLIEQDFLARRENVDRAMVVREKEQHTQISVVEDNILVEHYVSDIQEVATVGNIYLGRVQNVLPSMEAAFVDIGQARNGVLYAGEVNWDSARLDGQPRRIELAFKSGDPVLVQVTKDPIGHKGARLTSQVTLAGRFLVLVPSGGMTGVSRKLSEHERSRLKGIVTKIAPKDMGVIIRTAADHASEEAITKDLENLVRQWESVESKRDSAKNHKKPKLLKGEPDVAIRVVRDIFNDDFNELIVEGDKVYERISEYLDSMAPDLREKLTKWDPADHEGADVFDRWQIDGQLRKGMERQVYLPSGGSLVIDRTEAMTTIDVNTGRFIGKGKSLEETVTRCNLEASEEIARQLRLRDIGGMVMIDYVDMVMQANRDLVLRRLVECLARDRTKHQVAEVTSLGLVQMTRKRVGQGLVEAFSEECPTCKGRGFILHDEPTISASSDDPYAMKGGDPFIKSNPKHHAQPKDNAAPKGSSPDVKAKLAKIAAAAQSSSEDAD